MVMPGAGNWAECQGSSRLGWGLRTEFPEDSRALRGVTWLANKLSSGDVNSIPVALGALLSKEFISNG